MRIRFFGFRDYQSTAGEWTRGLLSVPAGQPHWLFLLATKERAAITASIFFIVFPVLASSYG
jgi:hypothetical protein